MFVNLLSIVSGVFFANMLYDASCKFLTDKFLWIEYVTASNMRSSAIISILFGIVFTLTLRHIMLEISSEVKTTGLIRKLKDLPVTQSLLTKIKNWHQA